MASPLEAIIATHVAAATAELRGQVARLRAAFEDLSAAHNDLSDRHERMFRPGVVTDYDPSKQRYRQVIGADESGNPIKSPWRPYSQHAGALKNVVPLSIGQQMLLISPDGDIEQGIGIPFGWSTANPSPSSDGDAIAGSFGGVSWSITGGVLTLTGALTVIGDFKASGGAFAHNQINVGSTHRHGGVQAGAASTGAPA